VIPFDYITEWRAEAPWIDDAQVEQDLVISRALVEIFKHPALADSLALRAARRSPSCNSGRPRGTRKTSISCRPRPSLPGR
jgi:hypothetical protein